MVATLGQEHLRPTERERCGEQAVHLKESPARRRKLVIAESDVDWIVTDSRLSAEHRSAAHQHMARDVGSGSQAPTLKLVGGKSSKPAGVSTTRGCRLKKKSEDPKYKAKDELVLHPR
ncbi:unnamed protein product [Linum trigynum]|uniref:Uncharacterized protein n=1 Tax=Linum trigynum TaxID=586398 RepID=A0AAV2CT71_9ROSI